MKGRDHVVVAAVPAAVALWAAHAGGAELGAAAYLGVPVVAALGALAPDIDHPTSLIGNGIPADLFVGGLSVLLAMAGAGWYLSRSTAMLGDELRHLLTQATPVVTGATVALGVGAGLLAVSLVVSRFVSHRGPTHSLLAGSVATLLVCVGCAVAGWPQLYGIAFGWGYASHLMADLPSRTGLPHLLWPFVGRG